MEIVTLPMKAIAPNTGQVPGLPANPRSWTKGDVERIAKSLKDTPELFEARPLLVYPYGGQYVILGGNLRHAGAQRNHEKDAPCIVFPEDTPTDKLKEIVVKDNGSFGSWDYDALGNEWDDLPLPEWGVPAWDASEMHLTTEGRQGAEGYQDFVDKFNEEQPLTTDDCYTPPEVYDLVKDFVDRNVTPLKGRKIVRPFFPGGDFEDLKQYSSGCVVLDNPPFSRYAEIVRFYLAHGIDFFLFGPHLSLLVSNADCCFCVFSVPIVYENGAKVSTGFATNLRPGVRIWVEHTLRDAVRVAQKQEPTTPVYDYPQEVINAALLGKVANGGDLEIMEDECRYIHNLDGMKEIDRGLFGGGLLLSRQAAEKARAAAEKARAVKIQLSPREQEIVNELSKVTKGQN